MSDEHYFTADPSVPFKRAPVTVSVWGHELELVTGSGVFAQGRLDIGTAVLFRETPPPTASTPASPRPGAATSTGSPTGPVRSTR